MKMCILKYLNISKHFAPTNDWFLIHLLFYVRNEFMIQIYSFIF